MNVSAPPRNATADGDPHLAAGRRLVDAPHQRCVVPPGALLALAEPAVAADDADAFQRGPTAADCRWCGADGRPPPPLVSAPLTHAARRRCSRSPTSLLEPASNNKPRVSVPCASNTAVTAALAARSRRSPLRTAPPVRPSSSSATSRCCPRHRSYADVPPFLFGSIAGGYTLRELTRAPPAGFLPRNLALWRRARRRRRSASLPTPRRRLSPHSTAFASRARACAPASRRIAAGASVRLGRLRPRRRRRRGCARPVLRAWHFFAWHDPGAPTPRCSRGCVQPRARPPPCKTLALAARRAASAARCRASKPRCGAARWRQTACRAGARRGFIAPPRGAAPVEEEETAEAAIRGVVRSQVSRCRRLRCVVRRALGQSLADTRRRLSSPPPWPG